MSNCVFTFEDTARIMRAVRLKLDAEDKEFGSAAINQAWAEAEQAMEQMQNDGSDPGTATRMSDTRDAIPAGHCTDDRGQIHKITAPKPRVPEEDIVKRPKCTEHIERTFTFSTGEVKRACAHFECLWGQPVGKGYRKKHSDGLLFALPEETTETERSEDEVITEVPELTVVQQAQAPVAGDESRDESRDENEVEDESDAEFQESFEESTEDEEDEYEE